MARSPLALAALATTAIPGLDVVATAGTARTSGDFQTTGVVDAEGHHWVVRCPLNASAGAAMEGEVALLASLSDAGDRLPFEVPRPAGFAELPEGGRAMVYPELTGRPLDLDVLTAGPGLSAGLGRAIAALHELRASIIADAGLPVYDAETYRARCLAEVDEAARTGHVPSELLNRWEHALENVALWRFRATPVHGDLAPENVLVQNGGVHAMTSFAAAHVGDPAEDLAWLMASAPLDSLDSIEEAYNLARTETNDAALMDRAVLVSELAVARWLLHGVRTEDATVVDDAAQMLRVLAEQVADEPPIGHRETVVAPGWSEDAAARPADRAAEDQTDADGSADRTDAGTDRTDGGRDTPDLPASAEVESVDFTAAEGTDAAGEEPGSGPADAVGGQRTSG